MWWLDGPDCQREGSRLALFHSWQEYRYFKAVVDIDQGGRSSWYGTLAWVWILYLVAICTHGFKALRELDLGRSKVFRCYSVIYVFHSSRLRVCDFNVLQ